MEEQSNAQGRRRGWPPLAANLVLAVAAISGSLLICELVLRILGVSYPIFVWTDPVRGVAHIPGASGGWVRINNHGWRGPDTPLAHPAGTYRIALLGDSYIEAFEVPFEQTVGEVITRRLSAPRGTPVEVLNFGEGGYGTTQELLTLQREVWRYSPDLVLLAVTTGNDISDNSRSLKQIDYVPYQVYQGPNLVMDTSFLQSNGYRSRALWTRRWAGLVKHSRVAQLINRVRHLSRKTERRQDNAVGAPGEEVGMRDEVQLPPRTQEWREAWRVTEGIISLMRDECRARHTPFAIVTLSRGIQVTPKPGEKAEFMRELGVKDLYYPDHRLADFGKREGIPVLNLAPAMAEQAEARHVYFHEDHGIPGKGHWNAAGHEAAGELIAHWLAGPLADTLKAAASRPSSP